MTGRHGRGGRRSGLLALLLALVLPGAGAAQPQAAGPLRLLIPLSQDTADARTQWLGEGAAIALSDELLALGAPVLSRAERLAAFERLHLPAAVPLSHATVIRVGQLVGAAEIVLGRVAVSGTDLVVAARVLTIESGRLGGEIIERGRIDDLHEICGRVARRLTPGTLAPAAQAPRPPFAAFEQYVKGLVSLAPSTRTVFLTQALWLSPALQDARFALWDVHTVQGQHQKALEVVRGVPPGHARRREAQFLAGLSLLSLGRYSEAAVTLGDLHRAEPNAALASALGVIQLRRGATAGGGRGSAAFAEASRLYPGDPDVFFNLGYAYWLEGNATAAVDALREAVRRAPADAEAHYLLGTALARSNPVESLREKDLATRLSSELASFEQGRTAVNALPRAMERVPTGLVGPGVRVADLIGAAEQRDQRALAAFHLEAARRLVEAERDGEAADEVNRAIYLSPYDAEALLLLGRLNLRAGMVAEAVDTLKVAIWCEDSVRGRLALAEAFLAEQDVAASRTELQIVIARDPQNAEAAQMLARLPAAVR